MNMFQALFESSSSMSFKLEIYDSVACQVEVFIAKRGRRPARLHMMQVYAIESFAYLDVDKIDWNDDIRKGREPREMYRYGRAKVFQGVLTLL